MSTVDHDSTGRSEQKPWMRLNEVAQLGALLEDDLDSELSAQGTKFAHWCPRRCMGRPESPGRRLCGALDRAVRRHGDRPVAATFITSNGLADRRGLPTGGKIVILLSDCSFPSLTCRLGHADSTRVTALSPLPYLHGGPVEYTPDPPSVGAKPMPPELGPADTDCGGR